MNSSTLLIWDAEATPPKGDWKTILWRSFGDADDPDIISVPKLVEDQADALRKRYLAWIYELGATRIQDKRLLDHLELRPGFSFWWMTLLTENSYAKSNRLYDAVRLFVLEDLSNTLQPDGVIMASDDKLLASVFWHWCRNSGIAFKWKQTGLSRSQVSLKKRVYHLLPYAGQAVTWLAKYILQRWPLRRHPASSDVSSKTEITFVDYLINLDHRAFMTDKFASNYWTDLIEILNQGKIKVNWVHLYLQHEAVPTARQAHNLITRFNHNDGNGLKSHASLDGALSLLLLFSALHDYIRLGWRSLRLGKIRKCFRPSGSDLNLWPLFKRDWFDSMRGRTAMWNCLALNLFERTLSQLPRQKLGIYLQENQGWEKAFIYAWRAAGHGHLTGVVHTTVRYWDFRYFYDPQNYECTGKNDLPMPDHVALNGPMALDAYRDWGYPEDQMIEVEALRYLYLAKRNSAKAEGTDLTSVLRILVCGDILPAASRQMMRWIETAANDLPDNTCYTVKPHPAFDIKASDYPSLKLRITNAPLMELLPDCDIVFTSNITSAAVDAYCFGIPVVSVLDGNTFNMSPLRGLKGVVYITKKAELVAALLNVKQREHVAGTPYFCLDNGLPRWRKLLGLKPVEQEGLADSAS